MATIKEDCAEDDSNIMREMNGWMNLLVRLLFSTENVSIAANFWRRLSVYWLKLCKSSELLRRWNDDVHFIPAEFVIVPYAIDIGTVSKDFYEV
jgi:hypothetical protein